MPREAIPTETSPVRQSKRIQGIQSSPRKPNDPQHKQPNTLTSPTKRGRASFQPRQERITKQNLGTSSKQNDPQQQESSRKKRSSTPAVVGMNDRRQRVFRDAKRVALHHKHSPMKKDRGIKHGTGLEVGGEDDETRTDSHIRRSIQPSFPTSHKYKMSNSTLDALLGTYHALSDDESSARSSKAGGSSEMSDQSDGEEPQRGEKEEEDSDETEEFDE